MNRSIYWQNKNTTCFSTILENTTQDEIDNFIKENISDNHNYIIIDPLYISYVPQYLNKSFHIEDNKLVPDMSIARYLHINLLRNQREKLLAPLDVAFMRAVERGDVTKQQIAAEKQKLRDITAHPAIDAATTLEELKDLTIDKLLTMTT